MYVFFYTGSRPRAHREDVFMARHTVTSRIYQAALQASIGLPCGDVSYVLLVLMAPLETKRSVVSGNGNGLALLQLPLGLHVGVCVSLFPGKQRSQNHRIVGAGRDLCGSSSPTLLPKQGHLQ